MSDSFNTNIVTTAISIGTNGTAAAGTIWCFRAPATAKGGGITITEAYILFEGTANFNYELLKCSASGTPDVNGTIGGSIGGTSWTGGVVKNFTLSTVYVSAGEWIALSHDAGTIAPASMEGGVLAVHYLMGK